MKNIWKGRKNQSPKELKPTSLVLSATASFTYSALSIQNIHSYDKYAKLAKAHLEIATVEPWQFHKTDKIHEHDPPHKGPDS